MVSMARMYTASIRNNFTAAEVAEIAADPHKARLLEKIRANIWHPKPETLLTFIVAPQRLRDDVRADVEYHLHTDRCACCCDKVAV